MKCKTIKGMAIATVLGFAVLGATLKVDSRNKELPDKFDYCDIRYNVKRSPDRIEISYFGTKENPYGGSARYVDTGEFGSLDYVVGSTPTEDGTGESFKLRAEDTHFDINEELYSTELYPRATTKIPVRNDF